MIPNPYLALGAGKQEVVDVYTKRVAAVAASYADAVRLLHAAPDRGRLAPAASAPAECAGYAAPPARLSAADGEVALGIARDGDAAIVQLTACQAEYANLVNTLNREQKP